jgi:hypothetical protein
VDARPRHQRRCLEHEAESSAWPAGGGEMAAPPANRTSAGLDEAGDQVE